MYRSVLAPTALSRMFWEVGVDKCPCTPTATVKKTHVNQLDFRYLVNLSMNVSMVYFGVEKSELVDFEVKKRVKGKNKKNMQQKHQKV